MGKNNAQWAWKDYNGATLNFKYRLLPKNGVEYEVVDAATGQKKRDSSLSTAIALLTFCLLHN